MRIVKEAEERKNEILDVAERLFEINGFDHTSTNDILKEVGIARGTLYYHFKSKEDILDAIIDRITGRLIDNASAIIKRREIPVLQRLTLTIQSLNVNSDLGKEIMVQVHRPQNALMHQKMREKLLTGVDPLIASLIREGIEQGIFQTEYPDEVVEMVMLYSGIVFDEMAEDTKESRERKIKAFICNLERLLGMEAGSMRETILPVFQNDEK
ncbi:MAG: TetR/AcrR family transcriptional regulator [Dorea sp.]